MRILMEIEMLKGKLIKAKFTLLELLVVVAIIAILITILLPRLSQSRQAAQAVVCLSNLKNLGTLTLLRVKDYNGQIPESSFGYAGLTVRGVNYATTHEGTQVSGVGRGRFYDREGLGQYLLPEGTNDYRNHAVYACPAATITHNWKGELVEYPFTYYVNTHDGIKGKAPWADNSRLRPLDQNHADYDPNKTFATNEPKEKDEYFTYLAEIEQADQLMSIYDVSQDSWGQVAFS